MIQSQSKLSNLKPQQTLTDRHNVIDFLKLVMYEFLVFTGIFQESMLRYSSHPVFLSKVQLAVGTLMIMLSLFSQRRGLFQWGMMIAYFTFALVNFSQTGYTNFILLGEIMFSMQDMPARKVLKWTLLIMASSVTVILLLGIIGKLPNLIYYRDGLARYSFGMIYPLTASAYLFSIGTILSLLLNKRALTVAILLMFTFITYHWMGARNDAVTIFLLAIAVAFKPLLDKFVKTASVIVPLVIGVLIVGIPLITLFIPYGTQRYALFNSLLSGRMDLQNESLNDYGLHLFGSFIPENGIGGYEGQNLLLKYFYIDSSFARIMYMGGILLFLVFLTIVILRLHSLAKAGMVFVAVVFAIGCINGLTQESFQLPIFNFLLPLMLTPVGLMNFDQTKSS